MTDDTAPDGHELHTGAYQPVYLDQDTNPVTPYVTRDGGERFHEHEVHLYW